MPLENPRSKSKERKKKSSDDKKKVSKSSVVKTISKDGKVSQVSKQSVNINIGSEPKKKARRGRPRKKPPAPEPPAPQRVIAPPPSGLVQQIFSPPPPQNFAQPQPRDPDFGRGTLAPSVPVRANNPLAPPSLNQAQAQAQARANQRTIVEDVIVSNPAVKPSAEEIRRKRDTKFRTTAPNPLAPPPVVAPSGFNPPVFDPPNPLFGQTSLTSMASDVTSEPLYGLIRGETPTLGPEPLDQPEKERIILKRVPMPRFKAEQARADQEKAQRLLAEETLVKERELNARQISQMDYALRLFREGTSQPMVGRSIPSSTIGKSPLDKQRDTFVMGPSVASVMGRDVPVAEAQPIVGQAEAVAPPAPERPQQTMTQIIDEEAKRRIFDIENQSQMMLSEAERRAIYSQVRVDAGL